MNFILQLIVPFLTRKLGPSWRTGLAGVGSLLVAIGMVGNCLTRLLTEGHTPTMEELGLISAAFTGAMVGLKARDNNVSTEQARAKTEHLPPGVGPQDCRAGQPAGFPAVVSPAEEAQARRDASSSKQFLLALLIPFSSLILHPSSLSAQTNLTPTAAVNVAVDSRMAEINGVMSFLKTVGEVTTVNGVYSLAGDGDYGGGFALHIGLAHVDYKDTRILFGPAYVTMFGQEHTRQALEVAVATKVINAEGMQAWFRKIPLLGTLPIDVSRVNLFAGAGLLADADPANWQRGLVASLGLGGIQWGQ